MSDQAELWRLMKQHQAEKRAYNKQASTEMLKEAGVSFDSKNNGTHLVVFYSQGLVDFWPSTGLWVVRGSTHRRRGVKSLLNFVKNGGM